MYCSGVDSPRARGPSLLCISGDLLAIRIPLHHISHSFKLLGYSLTISRSSSLCLPGLYVREAGFWALLGRFSNKLAERARGATFRLVVVNVGSRDEYSGPTLAKVAEGDGDAQNTAVQWSYPKYNMLR